MYLPDVSDGTEESRWSISAPVVLVFPPFFPLPPKKRASCQRGIADAVRGDALVVVFRTARQNEAHCSVVSFAATKNHLIVP